MVSVLKRGSGNELQENSKSLFKWILSNDNSPTNVGHIAKVKLVGGDYFKALSSLLIGLSTELVVVFLFALIFIGFLKIGILGLIIILVA